MTHQAVNLEVCIYNASDVTLGTHFACPHGVENAGDT